ncbi:MAG: trigger factor [Candidatus Accumulibacter phosphatis]|uniref:Trigger factor n=1 Tax=Candidatus Accumulibacter contiguus TaxID=2954381 RepID=A0ABX1T9B0_9PROT|nr:trigger factor [Candidatus Accumulibacter contiguus]MBL8409495.1 trigger factor [Accumulibacter sp.]NMQ05402.1 trigger factor [Candidatus Accumulibacter contiguus]
MNEVSAPGAPVVSALERRLDLSLNIADFEKDVDQRLKRLSKNMKMPGFRPGKVPASIARLQYGEQARHDALSEALGQLFKTAAMAQNLRVAGTPKIEAKSSENPTHLEFSAIFEVFPEIVLNDLAGVEIERPILEEVGSTEIDGTIDILRKQRVRYELVDRAAAKADRVSIDFLGKRDGQPFAGGQGKDYRFVLGAGSMLSDFESAVIGMCPGEAKTFDMTFPAEYFSQELAGQSVTFDISVKEVGEPVLPEVDADFARTLGIEDGDLVKMRAEIEDNLKREVKKRLQAKIRGQVMDALLQANPIEVPRELIHREIDRLMQSTRQDMEQRGLQTKDLQIQPEWFADQARRRVSLGLILSEIVKQHGLAAQPQQVKAMVEEAAQSYDHPQEVIRWHYAQPDRLSVFESAAIEANVVDWVLARVKVVDKPLAFAELMEQKS